MLLLNTCVFFCAIYFVAYYAHYAHQRLELFNIFFVYVYDAPTFVLSWPGAFEILTLPKKRLNPLPLPAGGFDDKKCANAICVNQ